MKCYLFFLGGIIGLLGAAFCFACRRGDDMIQEIIDKEEKLEIIEEAFNEYGECEHDVESPTSDSPGGHFVSYFIDKKGKEKILEAL